MQGLGIVIPFFKFCGTVRLETNEELLDLGALVRFAGTMLAAVNAPSIAWRFGMVENPWRSSLTRRGILMAAGFAGATLGSPPNASAGHDAGELIERLTGKTPTASDRLHLMIPRFFPNGYTVPLTLTIDSPMTEADHVRHVQVLAPRNPIVEVAVFHFVPQRSEPRVSTRIRLAGPQDVLAFAEMSDGSLLMSSTWVKVVTNGCT